MLEMNDTISMIRDFDFLFRLMPCAGSIACNFMFININYNNNNNNSDSDDTQTNKLGCEI